MEDSGGKGFERKNVSGGKGFEWKNVSVGEGFWVKERETLGYGPTIFVFSGVGSGAVIKIFKPIKILKVFLYGFIFILGLKAKS